MRHIIIIEPARSKYTRLTGQARTIFNRISLNLARMKVYSIKDEIVNIKPGPNNRKHVHYNDHKHFEIALFWRSSPPLLSYAAVFLNLFTASVNMMIP
jgi:hypothetical protein